MSFSDHFRTICPFSRDHRAESRPVRRSPLLASHSYIVPASILCAATKAPCCFQFLVSIEFVATLW
jgi:hypothetical protein